MATLSFRAMANSSRYVIEIGTSPGASNAAMLTTEEGAPAGAMFTRTLTDLPSGFLYARAKAQNQAGTSGPSAELRFLLQDLRYMTETLFLQSGPYGGGDVQSGHNVVRGFRAGTHVRIRVSTSVTSEQRRGIESMVSQLGETGAPLTATVETMSGNVAFCVRNEIHVVSDDRCGPMASCITACSPATLTTPWEAAAVFLNPETQTGGAIIAAHEIGHALLGLYHAGYLGVAERPSHVCFFGTPEFPSLLMYFQSCTVSQLQARLTDIELKAVQAAFRAGISAGSTRSDMLARGVIP